MVSLGEELKRERELREISLREISDATKISMRFLEAIENNNYKILPGGVFNRNFLRAYAEFVGLDPEIIVNKYVRRTAESGEINPPIFVSNQARAPVPQSSKKKILSYALIVVLFAGILFLVLWFLQSKGVLRLGEVPKTIKVARISGIPATPDRIQGQISPLS